MAAEALSPYEQQQQRKTVLSGLTVPQALARIVWGFALLAELFFAGTGFFNFQLAESAPQQAAAAAWGCFTVITPYVIARAFHEALTA